MVNLNGKRNLHKPSNFIESKLEESFRNKKLCAVTEMFLFS